MHTRVAIASLPHSIRNRPLPTGIYSTRLYQLRRCYPVDGLPHRVVAAAAASDVRDVHADVLELCQTAERREQSLKADASSSDTAAQVEWPDMQTFIKSSQSSLETLSSQELSKAIKAVAVAAGDTATVVDTAWLQQFAVIAYSRLGSLKTTELAAVIWGFGELGYNPGDAWLERFLIVSKDQLQEFYSSHLCDLIWGLSCIYRPAQLRLPESWLAAFMEESNYQLDEFPGDFSGFDLIKLVNGLAGQGIDLQERPEWVDSYLKSAYLKSGSFAESACMNQGLSRLKAGKMVMLRDSRCTHEEVNWLPRHERDMRRIMKNYKGNQWGGWAK